MEQIADDLHGGGGGGRGANSAFKDHGVLGKT